MRVLLLALLSLALACPAVAADARRYALMSLIGDKLQIATAKAIDSAMVDRIERNHLPLTDATIDRTAMQAANDAIKSVQPTMVPVLLEAKDAVFFNDQETLTDVATGRPLLAKLRDQLKNTGVTHLIVVLKDRYDGVPDLQRAFVGSRELEGVGFFIGRTASPLAANPSMPGPSFLAPFAYFRVALIDLGSGILLRQERAQASSAISAEQSMSGNAWEVLNAQQKVQVLQDMIRREMARVIPALLK